MNRDVNKDISKYDFDNLYIVANLPYYITTPIITKIINDKIPTNEIVIMIQKEVADRFSAKPGSKEYGQITVFLNYFLILIMFVMLVKIVSFQSLRLILLLLR